MEDGDEDEEDVGDDQLEIVTARGNREDGDETRDE